MPIEPKAPELAQKRMVAKVAESVEKIMARDGLISWTSPAQGSQQLKYRRKNLQNLKSLRQARDLLSLGVWGGDFQSILIS